MEKIEVIKSNGIERRYISKDLIDILDKIKENVLEYGWRAVRITDAEASIILAKKVLQAKIV